MTDEELSSEVTVFVDAVKAEKQLWALGSDDGGLVVVDSNQLPDKDCLLVWGQQAQAEAQCKDEWEAFTPVAISLDEFLDEWIPDLNEDEALIGLNWNDDNVCVEIQPVGLARLLVD